MTNQIPFRLVHSNEEGRSKLMDGVNELADTVGTTLGAAGKSVILQEPATSAPYPTKDGVTVAQYINPFDPVAGLGASLLREAANKTAHEAGDGTTTSIVLARDILAEAIPSLTKSNFRSIIDGINIGKDKVLAELEKRATEVTEENLINIATISANNDPKLGKLIADAYIKVGIEGTVAIGESSTNDTYIDILDGSSINSGYVSPKFINTNKDRCELKNAHVLIVDQSIANIWKLQNVLEGALKEGNALLIIGTLEPSAIATLAMNVIKNNLKVCVVEPPLHGAQRHAVLSDLALLTGANVIGEEYGNALETVGFKDLGMISSAVVESNRTIFKFKKDNQENIIDLTKDLSEKLQNAKGSEKGLLKYRLNLLTGKLAEIKVGATTEAAFKELKDRVDDAVRATQCALEEGIVPGGGVVLKDISLALQGEDITEGEVLFYNALTSPMYQIFDNAGITINVELVQKIKECCIGINVLTGEYVNVLDAGIIDPVKVTKNAVTNSVAVATTILGTDYIVTTLRASDLQDEN